MVSFWLLFFPVFPVGTCKVKQNVPYPRQNAVFLCSHLTGAGLGAAGLFAFRCGRKGRTGKETADIVCVQSDSLQSLTQMRAFFPAKWRRDGKERRNFWHKELYHSIISQILTLRGTPFTAKKEGKNTQKAFWEEKIVQNLSGRTVATVRATCHPSAGNRLFAGGQ